MPVRRKTGKLTTVFLTRELYAALREEAERTKNSVSGIIRDALIIYLEQRGYVFGPNANPRFKPARSKKRV